MINWSTALLIKEKSRSARVHGNVHAARKTKLVFHLKTLRFVISYEMWRVYTTAAATTTTTATTILDLERFKNLPLFWMIIMDTFVSLYSCVVQSSSPSILSIAIENWKKSYLQKSINRSINLMPYLHTKLYDQTTEVDVKMKIKK